jgi:hypothetical protein
LSRQIGKGIIGQFGAKGQFDFGRDANLIGIIFVVVVIIIILRIVVLVGRSGSAAAAAAAWFRID